MLNGPWELTDWGKSVFSVGDEEVFGKDLFSEEECFELSVELRSELPESLVTQYTIPKKIIKNIATGINELTPVFIIKLIITFQSKKISIIANNKYKLMKPIKKGFVFFCRKISFPPNIPSKILITKRPINKNETNAINIGRRSVKSTADMVKKAKQKAKTELYCI